jgi:methylase of polypeptide subunit release factors
MKKHITFVGLDVHKDSINVALADADRNGDVRYYGAIGGIPVPYWQETF